MAFVSDRPAAEAGVLDQARAWIRDEYQSLVREIRARRTIAELNRLSDRELQDIGLTRSDIPRVAYGLAEK